MDLHGRQLIGGGLGGSSTTTFRGANPATGEALEPAFHEASAADVDAACGLAGQAASQMQKRPPKDRAALLRAIAEQIVALGDDLIVRAMSESGLPRPRLEGERGRTVGQLKLFADMVDEG